MITVTKWSRLAVEITFHAAFVFHCLPALTALINGILACCVPVSQVKQSELDDHLH